MALAVRCSYFSSRFPSSSFKLWIKCSTLSFSFINVDNSESFLEISILNLSFSFKTFSYSRIVTSSFSVDSFCSFVKYSWSTSFTNIPFSAFAVWRTLWLISKCLFNFESSIYSLLLFSNSISIFLNFSSNSWFNIVCWFSVCVVVSSFVVIISTFALHAFSIFSTKVFSSTSDSCKAVSNLSSASSSSSVIFLLYFTISISSLLILSLGFSSNSNSLSTLSFSVGNGEWRIRLAISSSRTRLLFSKSAMVKLRCSRSLLSAATSLSCTAFIFRISVSCFEFNSAFSSTFSFFFSLSLSFKSDIWDVSSLCWFSKNRFSTITFS